MADNINSGFGQNTLVFPLLLECDTDGRITWLSDATRAVLGQPANLAAALGTAAGALANFHVWRVMTLRNGLLLGAQPEMPGETASGDLGRLRDHLLLQYFHLERVERKLSGWVRERRGGGGGASLVRQIERERQRLGRELHTGVGQLLAAIRMQLEVIAAQMPNLADVVQKALEMIGKLAADALEQVREVSHRLYPPDWQALALEDALRQLWERSGIPQRFQAVLRFDTLPSQPDPETKALFYRAAQEAILNIARHSNASRVELTLEIGAVGLILRAWDNGSGFDAQAAKARESSLGSGIGLRSIREQAASMGGKVDLRSGPEGTTFELIAPLLAGLK